MSCWGAGRTGALRGSSQGVTAPAQLRDAGGLAPVEAAEMGAAGSSRRSARPHVQQPDPVAGPGGQWGPPRDFRRGSTVTRAVLYREPTGNTEPRTRRDRTPVGTPSTTSSSAVSANSANADGPPTLFRALSQSQEPWPLNSQSFWILAPSRLSGTHLCCFCLSGINPLSASVRRRCCDKRPPGLSDAPQRRPVLRLAAALLRASSPRGGPASVCGSPF